VVFTAVRPVEEADPAPAHVAGSPAAATAESPAAATGASPAAANGASPATANEASPTAADGASPAAANGASPAAANGASPATATQASPIPATDATAASPTLAPARHPRRGARPAVGAWPAETRDAWRCEIAWDSGYRTSRFHAVVREPGQRRARIAARSQAFKWLLDGPPKKDRPEFEAAVRSLDAALVGAGWRRIPPGPKWYAQRYVWPGAEAPGALHYTS
jgi:hypothetical protein